MVVLDDDDAQRPGLRPEGNAEPARIAAGLSAAGQDGTALDERSVLLLIEQQRLSQPQRVRGDTCRIAAPDRLPETCVRWLRVEAVNVVRVVQELALFVVEGDVEVPRIHQLADDGVHGRVELGHLLDRAGGVGDAVERVFDLQGSLAVGLERLEIRDACLQRDGVGRRHRGG